MVPGVLTVTIAEPAMMQSILHTITIVLTMVRSLLPLMIVVLADGVVYTPGDNCRLAGNGENIIRVIALLAKGAACSAVDNCRTGRGVCMYCR